MVGVTRTSTRRHLRRDASVETCRSRQTGTEGRLRSDRYLVRLSNVSAQHLLCLRVTDYSLYPEISVAVYVRVPGNWFWKGAGWYVSYR